MAPDLWPLFDVACRYPLLCVRGALSDLFSEETLEKMQRRCPSMRTVVVDDVGHAPSLIEEDALSAIRAFLHDVHGL